VLLPRLRQAHPRTIALADGFSCRTQIHGLDSGGHEAIHVADLLAAAYTGGSGNPAVLVPQRPPAPSSGACAAATGLGGLAAASGAYAAAAGLRRAWTHLTGT
jgi:hypothetical protein